MKLKFKRLILDTLVFSIGNIGSKLVLFLLVPLYTNYLTTFEYGIADLVFSVAQLLIPVFSISLCNSVLRFGLSNDQKKEDVLVSALVITLVTSLGLVFLTPLFNLYIAISEWKWYLCIYVIEADFNLLLMNYLKVIDKNRRYSVISIIQTLVLAISNLFLLAYLNLGIRGYLLANILAYLVSNSCLIFSVKLSSVFKIGRINKDLAFKMILFSAPLIINDISWWVIHSSDKVMIESMISGSALGLYTAAAKIPSFLNMLISIFSQAWGISTIKEVENEKDIGFFSEVFYYYSTIVSFASILLISIVKPFFPIYVGSLFKEAWVLVPLLVASAAFSAISSYFGALYSALNKNVNSMITTVIAALANIVINYISIKNIGIWGAIVGTIVSCFIISVIRMIDVLRFIKIQINWRQYIFNYMIVVIYALIVSIDYQVVAISCLTAILFILYNFQSFTFLLRKFK